MFSVNVSYSGNSQAVKMLQSVGKTSWNPQVLRRTWRKTWKKRRKNTVHGVINLIIGLLRPWLKVTKWIRLLWRTARTLTLIARGHCACHPRTAMMTIPHSMIYGYWRSGLDPCGGQHGLWLSLREGTVPVIPGRPWWPFHIPWFMATDEVDSTPVEDSTDSDFHCERALCLSSQEGHGGQSTDHDYMDKTHKIHTLQQPWWIYGHRPWAYGFPHIYRL